MGEDGHSPLLPPPERMSCSVPLPQEGVPVIPAGKVIPI